MELFIKISQLICSLSILVLLHELGHFIPAKIFKTKVLKFYLFFNPWFSLVKKKIKGTVYGIGWLPLGGYVQIDGMGDEIKDPKDIKPYHFAAKKPWQRFIILIGGVFVNIVLAVFIYSIMLYFNGNRYIHNKDVKDGIWVISEAVKDAGIKDGDKIISIDGKPIDNFSRSQAEFIIANKFTIQRDEDKITKNIPKDFLSKLVEGQPNRLYTLRMPFVVDSVLPESPNIELRSGDIIIDINGKPIKYIDQVKRELENYKNSKVYAKVKRKDKELDIQLNVNEQSKIGVFPKNLSPNELERMGIYKLTNIEYNLFEAFVGGMLMSYNTVNSYIGQLKKIANPSTGAYKGVGGFVSIGNLFPSTWDWYIFWNITAFLSIMLAILNILPIPALDGGHLVFVVYEMIFRRKPNKNVLRYSQLIGIFILLFLFILANYNDAMRYFFK